MVGLTTINMTLITIRNTSSTGWKTTPGSAGWRFFENHDNPRMVSKVEPDPEYRVVVAKLLATMQLTLPGTPFIYQGQEIGMVNKDFRSIEEFRDIESLNLYAEWRAAVGERAAFQRILAGSRDHARTPMPWTKGKYAGFSTAEPWIGLNDDYKVCNIEEQMAAENSVLNHYRKLLQLRKSHLALVYGETEDREQENPGSFYLLPLG